MLSNIDSLLRARFTKAEFQVLESHPSFVRGMNATRTMASFERLSEVGEEILKVEHHAHPAARQFREGRAQGGSGSV